MQSHSSYELNLHSGTTYPAAKSSEIMFDIRNEKYKVLKDFDIVHEKQMHLIAVRKDRTNFQHVHPEFDENSGMFTSSDFKFPTDGEYRVFADFTAANAQMDSKGMKLASTPYRDVKVGDESKYTPVELSADKLTSSANGIDTEIVNLVHDTATEIPPEFTAGGDTSVNVAVKKNGQPYTNLEEYLGALGHMVVLGPNLEFIHAHPERNPGNQSGFVLFSVNFPQAGRYKLFLQTQVDGRVNTTDYAVSAEGNTYTGEGQPTPQPPDPGGGHSGH